MCTVVSLRNKHADYDISVARPGPFGNHFVVGQDGQRGECVAKFENWFNSDDLAAFLYRCMVQQRISAGQRIACWCKSRPCHAYIIAAYVNNGHRRPNGQP